MMSNEKNAICSYLLPKKYQNITFFEPIFSLKYHQPINFQQNFKEAMKDAFGSRC